MQFVAGFKTKINRKQIIKNKILKNQIVFFKQIIKNKKQKGFFCIFFNCLPSGSFAMTVELRSTPPFLSSERCPEHKHII